MKSVKTLIALLLCGAMLLSFAGCKASSPEETEGSESTQSTTASKEEQGNAATENLQEKASFDSALFGCWENVEVINEGDLEMSSSLDDLGILADGTFFYATLVDPYDGGVQVTTDGNKIIGLLEYAWEQENNDLPMPEWEITYEVSNIQKPLKDHGNCDGFYEKDEYDKLTLKITGTYQESPIKESTINTTIIYQKAFPMFSNSTFLEACLLGQWIDSQGNTWTFSYSDDEDPELVYTLTDKTGEVYHGSSLYCNWSSDDACEYLSFDFEEVNLGSLTVVSCNGNEFIFDVDGSMLILTKTA